MVRPRSKGPPMHILIESFIKSLPALPLLLAALYLLSVSAVSSAQVLAQQMLRLRIGMTLFMAAMSVVTLLAPALG